MVRLNASKGKIEHTKPDREYWKTNQIRIDIVLCKATLIRHGIAAYSHKNTNTYPNLHIHIFRSIKIYERPSVYFIVAVLAQFQFLCFFFPFAVNGKYRQTNDEKTATTTTENGNDIRKLDLYLLFVRMVDAWVDVVL